MALREWPSENGPQRISTQKMALREWPSENGPQRMAEGGPINIMSRLVMCAGTEDLVKTLSQQIDVIEYPSD
ncbi:hypothetical protein QZH41_008202 [Actinostola sp. cb2023]|nr:hypothetical protein QZH41_008202 [Actinostola sp. cb2023]